MNEQSEATTEDMPSEPSSSANSAERKKKSYKRNGWICIGLMLVVAVVNQTIVAGVVVDALQTGLLLGAIVCFVASARIRLVK